MSGESDVDLGITGLAEAAEVGSGGFASVYRARQLAFDRLVAVKVFHDVTVDEATLATFRRECQAVGRVGGRKNILVVYDQGLTASGRPYMTMPYLAGGSLQAVLDRRGRLPWPEAVDFGIKLAGALQIAHQASVLHRDVKPANVLLDDDGEPQLADFGIARLTDATRLTTGQSSFTPAHVAPEVLTGSSPTPLVDVYALGSTVFELIAGHPAFVHSSDDSFFAVMRRVESAPVPDLRPLGVPDAVCTVIESAMAKDPAQRPPSAGALAAALDEARGPWLRETNVLADQQRRPPPFPPPAWPPASPPPPSLPAWAQGGSTPPSSAWAQARSTPPSGGPTPQAPPPAGGHRGAWYAGIAAAVVVVAVIVVVALLGSKHTPSGTSTTTTPPGTSTPPSSATSPEQEAKALNSLLTASSSDRSAIVNATDSINGCTNFASDQQALQMAASSRNMLLDQLGLLNLSQIPNSAALVSALTSAWQASLRADNAYAAWAEDRANNGCGTPASSDANWQAAQTADQQATAAKSSFVVAWNPVASMYGLPQYTQAQI